MGLFKRKKYQAITFRITTTTLKWSWYICVFYLLVGMGDNLFAQGSTTLEEAQRHYELGQLYESAGAWQEAEVEYRAVLLLPDNTYTPLAEAQLEELVRRRTNVGWAVWSEIKQFSVRLLATAGKSLIIGLLAILALKIVAAWFIKTVDWVILPFHVNEETAVGETIAEMLADTLHEARMTHLRANQTLFLASEKTDIPLLATQQYEQRLLSNLTNLDSLGVEGTGLPLGSLLKSTLQWLAGGRHEITGGLWQSPTHLRLSARLETGRKRKNTHFWKLTQELSQPEQAADAIFKLTQRLAYQILYDSQANWGANSSESLQTLTQGLAALQTQSSARNQKENIRYTHALFLKAWQQDPLYQEAKYNLALASIQVEDYQAAINLLKPLQSKKDVDMQANINYNLGLAYYHLLVDWAYAQAENAFWAVIHSLEKIADSTTRREIVALAYCGLIGVTAQKVRQTSENKTQLVITAADYFNRAITIAGSSTEGQATAHRLLGLAYFNSGDLVKAVELFEQGVQIKPDDWRTLTHWGRANMEANQLVEAIAHLQQATLLNPSFEYGFYNLGLAYKKEKQPDKAAEAFAQAPTIAPAQNELGNILAAQGEYAAALAAYRQAVTVNSRYADAWANLAWWSAEAEETDKATLKEATNWAERALNLTLGSANEWHKRSVLARVLIERDRLVRAEEQLVLSITQEPSKLNGQSYYLFAEAAWKNGDLLLARERLVTFFQLNVKGYWQEKAVSLMRQIEQHQADNN